MRSAIISLIDEEGEMSLSRLKKSIPQHFTTIIPYTDFLEHLVQVMNESFST
ncbi:MAG: hypothetical protein IPH36_19605 [Saprospiraceae bacterium]|nr:hypothetical protein [Saprospiraceae bacterium]